MRRPSLDNGCLKICSYSGFQGSSWEDYLTIECYRRCVHLRNTQSTEEISIPNLLLPQCATLTYTSYPSPIYCVHLLIVISNAGTCPPSSIVSFLKCWKYHWKLSSSSVTQAYLLHSSLRLGLTKCEFLWTLT
jgi:hypothetical protein